MYPLAFRPVRSRRAYARECVSVDQQVTVAGRASGVVSAVTGSAGLELNEGVQMSSEFGQGSRDAAEGFGTAAEGLVAKGKEAMDALRGRRQPAPPRDDDNDDGGDINVTINR